MGKVGYIPWLDDNAEEQISEEKKNNYFYPFMFKQEEYEYEKEVRVLISGEESGGGFFVKTDLNNLIDEVILSPNSPPWSSIKFWENILRKYKIRASVSRSSLETTPEDVMDNIDRQQAERKAMERFHDWKEDQEWID